MTAKELEADILGTMMVGGDFTDDELVDQMLTFLAAGVCSVSFLADFEIIQLM
jgi:cytochrome P450